MMAPSSTENTDPLAPIRAAMAQEDWAGALALCQAQERQVPPSHKPLLGALKATVLGRLGRREAALKAAKKAHDAAPQDPAIGKALASLCLEAGQLEAARHHFMAYVEACPQDRDAWVQLGHVLQQQRDWPLLLNLAEARLQQEPSAAEFLRFKGLALSFSALHWQAVKVWRQLLLQCPQDPEVLYRLGTALAYSGYADQGGAIVKRGLELALTDPVRYSDRLVSLGIILTFLNEPTEAARAYRAYLALDRPDAAINMQAVTGLLETGAVSAEDPVVALAQRIAEGKGKASSRRARGQEAPSPLNRAQALTFLGRLAHQHEQYDQAFSHFQAAARLRASCSNGFDLERECRTLHQIKDCFSADLFERMAGTGHPTQRPIFILGFPRSGTTLVEQILSSHPDVVAGDERYELHGIIQSCQDETGQPLDYPQGLVARLTPALCRAMGEAYEQTLLQALPELPHFTDKMPFNCLHIGLIHLLLPRAPIILCQRAAMDVCLSCFQAGFIQGNEYANDLPTLGQFYRAVQDLMAHWQAVLPGRFLVVDYETLTADFEATARALLAHCGLEWHDACVDFHHSSRIVRTASTSQVRAPVHRHSVGRWRHYGAHLGPLIEALGPYGPGTEKSPAEVTGD